MESYAQNQNVNLPLLSKVNQQTLENYVSVSEKYSPIFQKGALYEDLDATTIVREMVSLEDEKFNYLTDYAPFSPEMQIYVELCSRILTDLAVDENQYESTIINLQNAIKQMPDFQQTLDIVKQNIDATVNNYNNSQIFNEYVNDYFTKNNTPIDKQDAVRQLLLNQKINEIVSSQVEEAIDKYFQQIVDKANELNPQNQLEFKNQQKTSRQNLVTLGAPASGKSTIMKNYVTDEQQKHSIVINPDIYRVFNFTNQNLPDHKPDNETLKSNNLAITAPLADVIQEKVIKRAKKMNARDEKLGVILDKTFYDKKLIGDKDLFSQNSRAFVSAYYGHSTDANRDENGNILRNTTGGPAVRSFVRAENATTANDARYFNTESILSFHKSYINNLIKFNAPFSFDIDIIDVVGKDLIQGGENTMKQSL